MKTADIVCKESFNTAHRFWRNEWSLEQNEAVFGKYSNKNWQQHNFFLCVTVKEVFYLKIGFVMDLKRLSRVNSYCRKIIKSKK